MNAAARLASYYFAFFAYAGALVPYFSLWLAAQGYGAAQIALVLAMPQVARVFAPALWGWLADHTGRQREIVVFGAFAVLAGFAALYVVRGAFEVALTMLVLSVLAAGAMPLVEAATLAATQGQAGRYGPIRLWGSIGFILTVLGAGAWLDHHGADTVLDLVVGLAAIVCVAAFGIPARARTAEPPGTARFGNVLGRGEVLAFFAACMCMSVAHGAMYAFYSIYLEAAGYSKAMIGALWTLGVVAEVIVFLRLPQLMRRFSLRALLIASFLCAAVRFTAIGWGVEMLAVLAAAQLLHAATFGAFHAASIAAVHRLFPGRIAARGQALYSSLTYGLGGAAGTLVAGWTWGALGPTPSFAVSASFGALGAILVAWKVRV
ncbi:MAG TPA: MFS transporter [Burkholderiales bacterium]|nr:MFS transporter [Burkholderiales bacterium]